MWGLLLGKDEMMHYPATIRSAITEFNATAIWQFFHIAVARGTGKVYLSALSAHNRCSVVYVTKLTTAQLLTS